MEAPLALPTTSLSSSSSLLCALRCCLCKHTIVDYPFPKLASLDDLLVSSSKVISHMEWYLRGAGDDMTVPDYEEIMGTLDCDYIYPSTNDWFLCKDEVYERQKLPNKVISRPINPTVEKSCSEEINVEKDEGSTNQNKCGETSFVDLTNDEDLSELHGAVEDQLEYHLDDSMEQMDDIFLVSLLDKEPLDVEVPYGSTTMEDLLSDMLTTPRNPTCGDSFVGSELHHQLWWDFPLSSDVDEEDCNRGGAVSPSYLISASSDDPEKSSAPEDPALAAAMPDESIMSCMVTTSKHQYDDMEVTALEELKHITKQLNLKTRICFRDALYRLAQCSEYRSAANGTDIVEAIVSETSEEDANHGSLRHKRQKLAELKTNVLDRTVANLLFDQRTCDFPYSPPSELTEESKENTAGAGSSNYFTIIH